jgi:hypothetical protein
VDGSAARRLEKSRSTNLLLPSGWSNDWWYEPGSYGLANGFTTWADLYDRSHFELLFDLAYGIPVDNEAMMPLMFHELHRQTVFSIGTRYYLYTDIGSNMWMFKRRWRSPKSFLAAWQPDAEMLVEVEGGAEKFDAKIRRQMLLRIPW